MEIAQSIQLKGKILIYDPILQDLENNLLEGLGCEIIQINEEAKRKVVIKTLFFMPHCGKALYNNLLWANWKPDLLQNLIILGNSFADYQTRSLSNHLEKEAPYIFKLLPYVTEVPIKNKFAFENAFHGLSVHSFDSCNQPKKSELVSNGEFWKDAPEPFIDKNDQEVIGNQVNNK